MTKTWSKIKIADNLGLKKSFKDYPAILQTLLLRRGLITKKSAEQFLKPNYERDLHDPFLLADMNLAVERILLAISRQEKIVIFGDYDADGVPGSAVLATFFRKIAFTNYEVYIPDRHNETYGLNEEAIRKLAEGGVKLIITVDCGITDVAEVALADRLGIEVIITDHHLIPEKMPQALAVLDAKRADDQYPFKMLAGGAVAFKLVQALLKKGQFDIAEGWEKWLLDLVAISTITDMVPLVGENRTLAFYGLKVLRQTRRLGLIALFSVAKVNLLETTEDDIGFMIGPRINSASRMSHASEAYELLMTEDPALARTLSDHLEKKNKDRRALVERIIQEVDNEYSGRELPAIIVAGNPGWSLGVLGLSASRLVEKYARPVFLWAKNDNGEIKGSCRSDGSVNLVELMNCLGPDFFNSVGGHIMAAGFSMSADREIKFAEKLLTAFDTLTKKDTEQDLIYDADLNLTDINQDFFATIDQLAPFGIDNPKPVFLFSNLKIEEAKSFGNGGLHLELKFRSALGRLIPAIGFFVCLPNFFSEKFNGREGHKFSAVVLDPGSRVDLLASLEKSSFRGQSELRLRIVDLRQPE
ncbi:MAG: single-stranded-DNA-specific exonuclease RecJ [Candidatus Vogelbacteria bacterium CG22_combo_CG10-13_8_21_14_all_37_9]|uniref:Single-stranded-DNA-specific exonuclease RecJ n=1 Tax=Candidatus Vogelbacteria bacterium CG22_combo_CG10-13_8_21_14_all_37_9 TaxID=1975046 RepID=A0A2H0BKR1_9BACT|nr:MAG: single-stranded-DNA-specific exonuclease RecJ [bacterium CG10_37_50]PIP58266.1 MAG: single-stranded-DNA-specific exonuclease RecJ [Candidatus Vogelbacteria bacterium CG22_combo_CG10-13_8_21_14_all_37_9]